MNMRLTVKPSRLFVCILAAACCLPAKESKPDDDADKPDEKQPFSVKVVDANGLPVEGAMAGLSAAFLRRKNAGKHVEIGVKDELGWIYNNGAISGKDGIVRFDDGRALLPFLCLVARHPKRKLVAIEKIDTEKREQPITLTLHPECRVSGRLSSHELAKHERTILNASVSLRIEETLALEYQPNESAFHFFAPAGEFGVTVHGENVHFVTEKVTVAAGQHVMELAKPVEMPATRWALLEGEQAPELTDVLAWKNGPALKLADLKGRCVVLEFWGHWCGACVHRMPDLFNLYDKYHDRGLEIVGIHVDLGDDEQEPIDSAERLDSRLNTIRTKLWRERDLPFPVALVSGKPVTFAPDVEDMARCKLAAEYGVVFYPTQILIDRQGRVVGKFDAGNPKCQEQLEKLLTKKQ